MCNFGCLTDLCPVAECFLFSFALSDIAYKIKLCSSWLIAKRIPCMVIPLLANRDLTPMHMQSCAVIFH